MRFQLLATVLACSAAFASFGAKASNPTPFDGGYVLEVLPNNTADHSKPSCVAAYAWNNTLSITAKRWPGTGLCGLGNLDANVASKSTVWDITPIQHTDGRKAYTIRSRVNGQCLHRGNSGTDLALTTWMWSNTNPQWCGMRSADEVFENGQAAWIFGDSTPEAENVVTSIAALRNGAAYLSFASTNRVGLQANQGMAVVDNVFRLSCVPETCTKPRAHDIIHNVHHTGNYKYSRPVRVMDAAYLDVPHSVWTPTQGMGNPNEQFVAILPAHAKLYCSRLRTGGFSDWRLPTPDEWLPIRRPYHHRDNQLWTNYGWPTGELPYQTSTYHNHGTLGLTIAGYPLYNNLGGNWYSVNNPYPIACVRD